MIRRLVTILFVLCWAVPSSADQAREIFRIRVENSAGGRVRVSIDQGKSFTTVGHVRRPAVSLQKGFSASAYTPVGTVAATAVHGIRIRVGTASRTPMTISLVPSEFASVPSGYGGHIPYGSGIYTNIHTGKSIFRNFAPFVGSPIKLERDGRPVDLPKGWKPVRGDVLVVICYLPQPYLREIEFENRKGGAVTARYDDGREERIATVLQPVAGVGRFDAASYTGVGLVNTNHGGVITIGTSPISHSTLPEGKGKERRGGFQIQPSEHAKTQYAMPQSMVIAPIDGEYPLEGQPPLFLGCIGLAYDPTDTACSFRAEVRLRGGPWQSMPEAVGKVNDALSRLGVTAIRLLFPRYDQEFLARSLARW